MQTLTDGVSPADHMSEGWDAAKGTGLWIQTQTTAILLDRCIKYKGLSLQYHSLSSLESVTNVGLFLNAYIFDLDISSCDNISPHNIHSKFS